MKILLLLNILCAKAIIIIILPILFMGLKLFTTIVEILVEKALKIFFKFFLIIIKKLNIKYLYLYKNINIKRSHEQI